MPNFQTCRLEAQLSEGSACTAQRSLDLAIPIVELGSKLDVFTSLEKLLLGLNMVPGLSITSG